MKGRVLLEGLAEVLMGLVGGRSHLPDQLYFRLGNRYSPSGR